MKTIFFLLISTSLFSQSIYGVYKIDKEIGFLFGSTLTLSGYNITVTEFSQDSVIVENINKSVKLKCKLLNDSIHCPSHKFVYENNATEYYSANGKFKKDSLVLRYFAASTMSEKYEAILYAGKEKKSNDTLNNTITAINLFSFDIPKIVNPFSETINIIFPPNYDFNNFSVTIINSIGVVVLEREIGLHNKQVPIITQNLPSGIYLCQFKHLDKQQHIIRITKE